MVAVTVNVTTRGAKLSQQQFARLANQVKKFSRVQGKFSSITRTTGKNVAALRSRLTEFSKTAQIALGPLSGVAARVNAFSTLVGSANLKLAAFLGVLVGFGAGLLKTIGSAKRFEAGLAQVAKTTGFAGKELEAFGDSLLKVSSNIGISTKELNTIAALAGQLGIRGTENILQFTEVIAKLARTSDLTADQAATALARILTVTGETTDKVGLLADVLTKLAASAAASESEIVRVTNEVARGIGVYKVSSVQVAVLATGLRQLGVRAEAGGTAMQKAFAAIGSAISDGGKKLQLLIQLTGLSGEELTRVFEEDAFVVFNKWIQGIGRMAKSAIEITKVLKAFELADVRVARSIIPLITNSEAYIRLLVIMEEETQLQSALQEEFDRINITLNRRLEILGTNLDNISTVMGLRTLPSVKALINGLIELTSESKKVALVIDKIGVALLGVLGGAVLGVAARGLSRLVVGLGSLGGAFAVAGTAAAKFKVSILGLARLGPALFAVVGAILAIGAAFLLTSKKVGEESRDLAVRIRELTRNLETVGKAGLAGYRRELEDAAEEAKILGQELEDQRTKVKNLQADYERFQTAALTATGTEFKNLQELISGTSTKLDEEGLVLAALQAELDVVLSGMLAFARSLGLAEERIELLSGPLKDLKEGLEGLDDQLDLTALNLRSKLTKALNEAKRVFDNLSETGLTKTQLGMQELQDVSFGLVTALVAVRGRLLDLKNKIELTNAEIKETVKLQAIEIQLVNEFNRVIKDKTKFVQAIEKAERDARSEIGRTLNALRGEAAALKKGEKALLEFKEALEIEKEAQKFREDLEGLIDPVEIDAAVRAFRKAKRQVIDLTRSTEQFRDVATRAFDSVGNALEQVWIGGIQGAEDFRDVAFSVIRELQSLLFELAISNPLRELFGLSTGGTLGGLLEGLFSSGGTAGLISSTSRPPVPSSGGSFSFLGFQRGGSLKVGGSGGTDSQFLPLLATPGETLTVETPEQRRRLMGGGVFINIDLRGSNGDASIQAAVTKGIRQAAPFLINASVTTTRGGRQRNPKFFSGPISGGN